MKTVETFTFSPVNEDSFLGNMNSCILNLSVCKSKACWYYDVVFLSFLFVKAAAAYSRKKSVLFEIQHNFCLLGISARDITVSVRLFLSPCEKTCIMCSSCNVIRICFHYVSCFFVWIAFPAHVMVDFLLTN